MITNKGKDIIVKYMLGQTPSYASYIALGCGPNTLSADESFDVPAYRQKTSLDFEMFRVPVTSKGYIKEEGISKIVLTAQLPTAERYQITEIGLFSAAADALPGANNSKMLVSFAESENWTYFSNAENTLKSISRRQGAELSDIDNNILFNKSSGSFPPVAWNINSDDVVFLNVFRSRRNEVPRYLNNSVMMAGNISTFEDTTNPNPAALIPGSDSSFIQQSGISIDLTKNSPNDLLKISYSIVDKKGYNETNKANGLPDPDKAKLLIEFSDGNGEYKRFGIINNSICESSGDNRYYVATIALGDETSTTETSGFSWSAVNTIRIYANVSQTTAMPDEETEGTNFFIALDAIRIDVNSVNPLYGLTGYTAIRNTDSFGAPVPVDKKANSSNFIEFRFAMDVV